MKKSLNKKSKHKHIRNHFKAKDPVIHKAMGNLDFGEWITPHNNHTSLYYFQKLCREIIGQQLSGSAATTINGRFEKLFRGGVTPDKLLRKNDRELRDVGMSWAKVSYVKNIATAFKKDHNRYNVLKHCNNEEVKKMLTAIKGVGPWTAEMFLIFTLGREDVFSHGDLGLRNGFSYLYNVKNPTKDYIDKVISKWTPYKTYGSITLWHSLDTK